MAENTDQENLDPANNQPSNLLYSNNNIADYIFNDLSIVKLKENVQSPKKNITASYTARSNISVLHRFTLIRAEHN